MDVYSHQTSGLKQCAQLQPIGRGNSVLKGANLGVKENNRGSVAVEVGVNVDVGVKVRVAVGVSVGKSPPMSGADLRSQPLRISMTSKVIKAKNRFILNFLHYIFEFFSDAIINDKIHPKGYCVQDFSRL